jgi:transcriptional regulator with GAF, ATPase, and Fis domain
MFVAVNVGAMVSTLIESELFGHEKGAFTGATSQRVGKFELANNGTLFLDEIGELTPELQIKFLRVLQHQEFQRVGGTSIISTDARIIAATNQNLEEKIKNGSFRQDLYYRLNVFPIYLPPLRKRKDDIPDLVHYFIKKYNKKFAKSIRNVTRDAMEVLLGYDWPGNVRELENIVQRMMIKCKGERMGVDEIPFEILSSGNLRLRSTEAALENFIDALITTHDFEGDIPLFEKIESSVARRMMKRWGKKRDVMEKLKISAPTLDKLLKR